MDPAYLDSLLGTRNAFGNTAGVSDKSEADRCRLLWGGVLLEQWKIALSTRAGWGRTITANVEISQARTWFGGKDFRIVCDFAGLDPDVVMRGYHEKLAKVEGREA